MGRTMNRGKQQILYTYLPGRTFDFEKGAAIGIVRQIRGKRRDDLNLRILLMRVADEISAWPEEYRPLFRDDIIGNPSRNIPVDADRFVLVEPEQVRAELFPKVFWCDNRSCGKIYDFSNQNRIPPINCTTCQSGKLVQMRFIKVHRCGHIAPLQPPSCQNCNSNQRIALDLRGSERISNFRWVCRRCGTSMVLMPRPRDYNCPACQWPENDDGQKQQQFNIEVHRANATYYAQTTTLINLPGRQLDQFFSLEEWPLIAAARCLNLPEAQGRQLYEYGHSAENSERGLSRNDLEDLLSQVDNGNLDPNTLATTIRNRLGQQHNHRDQAQRIAERLEQATGVNNFVWKSAGLEMLESVLPLDLGRPISLSSMQNNDNAKRTANLMGVSGVTLLTDFPMIIATYGYTRVKPAPRENAQNSVLCRVNPFPAHPDYRGKTPIFVDEIRADALNLTLDPNRVIQWLRHNGFTAELPGGSDIDLSIRAYFVQLFDETPLRETIQLDRAEARMVFGLIHTLSHIAVRQAELLCGLQRTSLSEYVLPRTLSFAVYSNHRFGATIGALSALFEQTLFEWLEAIRGARRCVYDPVCKNSTGSCHACTHLAETSCRYFNLNLGRAFLFGGYDPVLGQISGYFDL